MIERSDSNSNGNGKDNRKCLKEKAEKPNKHVVVVGGHDLICANMLCPLNGKKTNNLQNIGHRY